MSSFLFIRRGLLLLSLMLCAGCAASSTVDDRPPNVVIIFTDDQGYADVGCYGAQGFTTPNIDRMAAEGLRFTDFYVSQAVCSASRASLMTGCYSNRIGILHALGPNARHGLNSDETTLAEICKSRGYATAIFGKWHLGHREPFLPLQHGFDEYYGLPYSNDMWADPRVGHEWKLERWGKWPLPLIEGNETVGVVATIADQDQLTTAYTERAVAFIEQNQEQPFFLYVPHSMPHVPLGVSDKFRGASEQGLYGDVMMEIDWSVGQILQTLKRCDLDANTLVIFATDNGPWINFGERAGSAAPLREAKGTMWDGGCRVPCVMRWPDRIPAGGVCREMAATIDILPTIAHLIGADQPALPIDGKNIWPMINGAATPHEAYYMYYANQLQAVRSGRWKLHFPHNYRTLNGRAGGVGGFSVKYDQAHTDFALYDLKADIGETTNVLDEHPEVVARLKEFGEAARRELGDSATKQVGTGVRPPGRLEPESQPDRPGAR